MSAYLQHTRQGTHFKAIDVGPLAHLDQVELSLPMLDKPVRGKLFIKDLLQLSGMEVSLNKLGPGKAVPFWHRHLDNEEVYIFLGGIGEFYVDDTCIAVEEGTIVAVKPQARRVWRNTGNEDLYYIVIQAKNDSLEQYSLEDSQLDPSELPWKTKG